MQGVGADSHVAKGASSHAATTGRCTTYMTHDMVHSYAKLLVEHLDGTDPGISACDTKGRCLLAFVSGVEQSLSECPGLSAAVEASCKAHVLLAALRSHAHDRD